MSKEFDEFVDELQGRIYEEARKDYGEVAFNRWLTPKYMGDPDFTRSMVVGKTLFEYNNNSQAGQTVKELWLRLTRELEI